ncbi:DUF1211 domain-containing protein, partial [Pseudomonas sp. MPR-R2A5]
FSTAYLGEQHFSRDATLVYLVTMFVPSIAYAWLQRVIRATGVQGVRATRYHVATLRKGIVAILLYLAGMPLSFVSPWLGIACAM